MNNDEYRLWVSNDEYLYQCWTRSEYSLEEFIERNASWIEAYIQEAVSRPSRPDRATMFQSIGWE